MVNVILHPLGQDNDGEGTLHRVLDLPTHLESSAGSRDPLREFYAITGGGPTESDLKHQQDDETLRR